MSGLLNHSPADIVCQLLISLGLVDDPLGTGTATGWEGYVSNESSVPDNVVTVYDTQGKPDGRVMTSGEQQEHHGFQLRVRGADAQVGFAKARALAVALDQTVLRNSVTLGTSTYLVQAVSRTGEVIPLGTEPGTSRELFTINATIDLTLQQ
jgi:hypothetical protein